MGTGIDLSIRELAEKVAAAMDFKGSIHWDHSKPDGTPKKQLDVSRLSAMGWRAQITLSEGLISTVTDFSSKVIIYVDLINERHPDPLGLG